MESKNIDIDMSGVMAAREFSKATNADRTNIFNSSRKGQQLMEKGQNSEF